MLYYLRTFDQHNYIPKEILMNSIDAIVANKPILTERERKELAYKR